VLSEIVKKMLEEKAGMRIRYSRDCDILSAKIFTDCRSRISGSTLRRLFGFTKGTKEPRLYTLDVVANYLGFSTWDDMLVASTGETTEVSNGIKELMASAIEKGERYRYTYRTEAIVEIEYIGGSRFKVLRAENSKLCPGDTFNVKAIILNHPLFIKEIKRGEERVERIVEAHVSGITTISKIS
jgi:hypothetical protein